MDCAVSFTEKTQSWEKHALTCGAFAEEVTKRELRWLTIGMWKRLDAGEASH